MNRSPSMRRPSASVLACAALSKDFTLYKQKVSVLKGIDFILKPGEKVAIMGPSGAGKTTLLSLLGGLDSPSKGRVFWQEQDISRWSSNRLAKERNSHIGFVYQFHHLLLEFSALENVAMPLVIGGEGTARAEVMAGQCLKMVGLSARSWHKPSELSGGERQRVAVARALAVNPRCLLMDEPTGNLDDATAIEVQKLFISLTRKLGTALIVVTHSESLARVMDKIYVLSEGQLKLK